MRNDRLLAALGALLGLVLVAIGVTYIGLTEHDIPSFFPGHVSQASSHHHVKHGLAAIFLGLGQNIAVRLRICSSLFSEDTNIQ